MTPGRGLRDVPVSDLERLLAAAYRGHISFPVKLSDLMLLGMNRIADHGALLQGLDERGLRSLLIAVIAERKRRT